MEGRCVIPLLCRCKQQSPNWKNTRSKLTQWCNYHLHISVWVHQFCSLYSPVWDWPNLHEPAILCWVHWDWYSRRHCQCGTEGETELLNCVLLHCVCSWWCHCDSARKLCNTTVQYVCLLFLQFYSKEYYTRLLDNYSQLLTKHGWSFKSLGYGLIYGDYM